MLYISSISEPGLQRKTHEKNGIEAQPSNDCAAEICEVLFHPIRDILT